MRQGQRGGLSVLDILVMGVLLGLLIVAATREFPAYRNRTTPAVAPIRHQWSGQQPGGLEPVRKPVLDIDNTATKGGFRLDS